MARNMLIGQSGGPTVAVNASLSGAIKRAMKHSEIDEIYGVYNGVDGLLKEKFINLRPLFRSVRDFQALEDTPAMALGSCRYKLPRRPDPIYDKIRNIFHRHQIEYFFYIGGNDSMDTIMNLSDFFRECDENIRCVGIPKTIDNDLPCTDHAPGFGSAARFVAFTIAEIACDSAVYDTPSVSIVEIMGRNAGWLTASAALARREGCTAPHLIYLPEAAFNPDEFLERLQYLQKNIKHIVVAVSEGIRYADSRYVSTVDEKTDAFGHRALAGAGRFLEQLVSEQIGCKTRSIELNVLQRSATHLKSYTDINEACRIGAEAVTFAVKGKIGVMAVFKRILVLRMKKCATKAPDIIAV